MSDFVWNLGRQPVRWLWLDKYVALKQTTKVICLQGEKQIIYLPRGKACPKLVLKNQNLVFPLPAITHEMTPKSFIQFPSLNILFATCLLFLTCLPAMLVTDMGSFTSELNQFHFLFLPRWHILSQ